MKYLSSNTKKVYDIEFTRKRNTCPECNSDRKKKDQKDLEYHSDTNTAFCFHCRTTYFEYKPYEQKKEYIRPEWKNKTDLSDDLVKYFESRMISQKTLIEMRIYSDREWMPQFKAEVPVICFPFFKDDTLVNIKYRGAKKSFKMVSGAELIWYNHNAIKENNEIIICEGEIDQLTFIENGFKNVVSVPNGAQSNSDFLDNSIHEFDHIEKIYLATDVDKPGLELRDELIRRFGAERCYSVNFKGYKDANEYFCKVGGFEFKDIIKDAQPIPIEGNIEIPSFYKEIIDLYKNGLQPGLTTGIEEIDKYCTWETRRLCTVTGIPGMGKSEFIDYIICRLNILYGWKAAYFTPENYPISYHYAKIHEKFSGSKFKADTDKTDFDTIYEHIKNNFFYILNEEDLTIDSVIKSAKAYVKSKGIKILVIDPYNKLDHQYQKGENETQYVSRFLDLLTNFARLNNVLVFLIAHPVKMQKNNGVYDVPNLYSISGSANFYNKTDYGVTVYRPNNEEGVMSNIVNIYWQKIKFKHLGTQGMSELSYNINNGRFDELNKYDNMTWMGGYSNQFVSSEIQPNTEFLNEEIKDDCPF